jgi:pyruvate/2-oxoglutarate dehydrogenase complex dihydrolipoamide acyltransferase (E2) component
MGKEGLIVPVVKNADRKSIIEISRTVKDLVEKARAGNLMPDDVTGGTFTLTSVGSIGVSYFQTPILNQPEAGILATSPLKERPVVRDGEIGITTVMPYSLTVDHRLVNGFGAELFLKRVGELLEIPGLLLL